MHRDIVTISAKYEAKDNVLLNNLGSKANSKLGYQQLSSQHDRDGDDYRATFYVKNPQNDWIENVAGGGAGRG